MVTVRSEKLEDIDTIRKLNESAFGQSAEADIVESFDHLHGAVRTAFISKPEQAIEFSVVYNAELQRYCKTPAGFGEALQPGSGAHDYTSMIPGPFVDEYAVTFGKCKWQLARDNFRCAFLKVNVFRVGAHSDSVSVSPSE